MCTTHLRKPLPDEDEALFCTSGRTKPKLIYLLLLSFISCSLVLASMAFFSTSNLSLLYSSGADKEDLGVIKNGLPCSSVPNGTICCDRKSIRSDVCVMRGDVRTSRVAAAVVMYGGVDNDAEVVGREKIKPYTRKWETSVMDTIDELDLVIKRGSGADHCCDVRHDVPAVFFSTGGYTGNLYHEFNDGIIPLYITSQHFNKRVVFVMLEYHNWWIMKYEDVLSQLSDYPAIDFSGDKRVHCFPEAIVGLRIHDELSIDTSLMEGNKSIRDFRDVLDKAYLPRIQGLIHDEECNIEKSEANATSNNVATELQALVIDSPKLVILSRNGSRSISNEASLVELARDIGFSVEVLRPQRTTELAKIYRTLNSSDVMIGVHGAAMTHFLFMRPRSVFIQIVPLGTEWAAETYYGEPARKFGLKYIGYKILPKESSLYDHYDKNDPILRDPSSITKKGWEYTKRLYLDGQTVKVNLKRFRKRLIKANRYSIGMKNRHLKRYISE